MGSRKVEKEFRVENASRQHSRHTKAENKMEIWAMMTMFYCEEVKLYHIFEKKVNNQAKNFNILTKQKFIYYIIVYFNSTLKKCHMQSNNKHFISFSLADYKKKIFGDLTFDQIH